MRLNRPAYPTAWTATWRHGTLFPVPTSTVSSGSRRTWEVLVVFKRTRGRYQEAFGRFFSLYNSALFFVDPKHGRISVKKRYSIDILIHGPENCHFREEYTCSGHERTVLESFIQLCRCQKKDASDLIKKKSNVVAYGCFTFCRIMQQAVKHE